MRLFDLFHGPHWTLLAFGMTVDQLDPTLHVHTVIRLGEPTTPNAIVDHEGHVHASYDATDGTLMLIRPDGHIALATNDGIERIAEYWTMLLAKTPAKPIGA